MQGYLGVVFSGRLRARRRRPHLGSNRFRLAHTLQSRLATDRLRPQFHLLPAANWMNDPNGPIFHRGRYHMFFQYNPNGAFWGSMHWAHATSPDMIHWQHEPVAIAPTPDGWDRDGVFSGSTVVDGTTTAAIYTGVLPPSSPSQSRLRTATQVARSAVYGVREGSGTANVGKGQRADYLMAAGHMAITGFRDPGVWREGKEWLLTLGSGLKGKGGAVLLYESRDLRRWTYRHPLIQGHSTGHPAANPVDNGEMWECPDFFPLGDRHVLLYAAMGKVFWKTGIIATGDLLAEMEGVVDFGAYYAAKTMLDERGNRILWGWIPEIRPESDYRAAGWAGVMALPRVLSLGLDRVCGWRWLRRLRHCGHRMSRSNVTTAIQGRCWRACGSATWRVRLKRTLRRSVRSTSDCGQRKAKICRGQFDPPSRKMRN